VISRLVGALLVILATIFAMPVAIASAPASADHMHAFTYHDNHHTGAATYTTTERGPPAAYNRGTDYDAVDLRSRGASARANGPATLGIHDYDDIVMFVRIARGSNVIEVRVGGSEAGHASSDWPAVGRRYIQLSTSRWNSTTSSRATLVEPMRRATCARSGHGVTQNSIPIATTTDRCHDHTFAKPEASEPEPERPER